MEAAHIIMLWSVHTSACSFWEKLQFRLKARLQWLFRYFLKKKIFWLSFCKSRNGCSLGFLCLIFFYFLQKYCCFFNVLKYLSGGFSIFHNTTPNYWVNSKEERNQNGMFFKCFFHLIYYYIVNKLKKKY